MGTPKLPKKPLPNPERRSERYRFQEQLWIAAYERLVTTPRRSLQPSGARRERQAGGRPVEWYQGQAVGG